MTEQFPRFYLPSVCDPGSSTRVPGLVLVACEPEPRMEAVPALSAFLRGETDEWPCGYGAGEWHACDLYG